MNRITRDEQTILLEPKVMEVLALLAKHAGHVVRRDELMETVWPGLVVTEEALTRCISALRNAFEDDYKNPAFIETIRKTGYRLIAPVVLEEGPAVPHLERPASSSSPRQALQRRRGWRWGIGVFAIIGAGLLGAYIGGSTPEAPSALRIVPFTAFPGNEMEPAFSPDGNHIAFARDRHDGTHIDVYIKSLTSETALRVTRDSAYDVSPTWSPDGTQLAFARVWDTCEIVMVPVFGGPERKLAACGGWGNPQLDWSPDVAAPMLAISEAYTRREPHRIVLLSLETLEKRPLTHPLPQHRGDRSPRFSPDGKTLAFIRTTDQVSEIYLVPISGGSPRRLTFDNLDIAGLAWTPDGQSLVYASNQTGTYSLWRIAIAGGSPELLLVSGESMLNPALVARDGLLVYEQWSNERNIYRLPINAPVSSDATPPEVLIASTHSDAEPRYSPTGDRIAFVSNRSGASEIWMSDANGTNPVQLTAFEGPATRHPSWSPDGTQLAFDSRVEGNADIYLLEPASRNPRRLTTAPSIDTNPSWSPDGEWVFFMSDRTGTWNVWKAPVAGGEAVQVTRHGGFNPQVSLDGEWLYYTKRDTSGIWRTSMEGGEESRILPLLPADHDAWTVAKEGIYALRYDDDPLPILTLFTEATGEVSDIALLPINNRQQSLTLSPDGAWLLYSQLDRSESDLVLTQGLRW